MDPEIRIMLEAKEESGSRIQENYQQKNSCLCFEICFLFWLLLYQEEDRSEVYCRVRAKASSKD